MTQLAPGLASLHNDDKLAMLEVPDIVTVDTEGVSSMMGMSVCFDGMFEGFYLPFDHARGNMTEAQQKHAFKLLSRKEALVFHNAAHDLEVLRKAGLTYLGKFYDTMLMAHWINEERVNYSLNVISQIYGGQPKEMPNVMSLIIESDGWHAVPVPLMDLYSGNDAFITHQLFRTLLPSFQEQGFEPVWEHEQAFIRHVLIPMMRTGIRIDAEFCIKEYMRGQGIMDQCRAELGFKPTSPVALEKFLIKELGLPVVKHTKACKKCFPEDRRLAPLGVSTHTAKASFDKEAMAEYEDMLEHKDDPRATTILRYRGWLKTNSSNYKPYMDLMDEKGVLHPGFKLHGTRTRRLSCEKPNLQQIPKSSKKDWNGNLKAAFIPRSGYELWTVDYAQLQFRMTCAYAECELLLAIFRDPTRDIFSEMATQMGWIRDNVKTLVYLILFGGGAVRASHAFGVSVAQGRELVEEFHTMYPEIKKVAKMAEAAARRQGYARLWSGWRRHFPRGSAYHKAFNAVIQGGEADIMKRAMTRVAKEICELSVDDSGEEACRIVLQIHDEIVFEIKEGRAPDYLPGIQSIMEDAGREFCEYVGVDVPFKTDAKPWGKK